MTYQLHSRGLWGSLIQHISTGCVFMSADSPLLSIAVITYSFIFMRQKIRQRGERSSCNWVTVRLGSAAPQQRDRVRLSMRQKRASSGTGGAAAPVSLSRMWGEERRGTGEGEVEQFKRQGVKYYLVPGHSKAVSWPAHAKIMLPNKKH